ncbi:MAG: hypothetical protein A2087_09840 [Spirochaetes bacterium GWD1_61_31]|nr:MAG: hypothetical protein A2Y37_07445 [Spirochaetes bacterium GWB1_60_80]OHD34677.1 MAG: hypothetical protein A2004_01385 [Spirochaetes bacterium GWC1_61_12]OHD34963.1 MAG: hypothetical protein A2087_09840 [Spirochaetes bacterium GWD1_61_31]OHD42425.1 MAG: hypothetical protein A2Y35_06230 [Spirochaetes bacterium GWE1_60_18]OHD59228.1 MAG: hypothetical protein A2Y32_00410 [Spirochaetes bacterium GWF1_60_12]
MKNLQKAGGVAALVAAGTYLFAMVLLVTVLAPLEDSTLGFAEYIAFLSVHQTFAFAWDFIPYILNGVCLALLALALYERMKAAAPRLATVATTFGFIWVTLVFLSGFIAINGNNTLLSLAATNPAQAETLRLTLDTVTAGIDSSDKILGCLWVGLMSLAGFRTGALCKSLSILGMAIGSLGLAGSAVPALAAVSYAFGVGVIAWWIGLGIYLLRGRNAIATTNDIEGVSL